MSLGGLSVLAFIHPDDARLLENSCVCLLGREAKSRLFEARVLAPDGNWTWMEVQLRDLLDVQAGRPHLGRISKPSGGVSQNWCPIDARQLYRPLSRHK